MRYIDLNKLDTRSTEFLDWKASAQKCQVALKAKTTHEERSTYLRNHAIWSELKPLLIATYGPKCWYSECDITGFPGDIDHYRPKNKSVDEDGNILLSEGYWWLAYEYLNYRLCCENCNRPYQSRGKSYYFPIEKGTLPANIGENNDKPLLLDPCNPDDVKLIDCNDSGRIISLSSDPRDRYRVAVSNRIYNWNLFDCARKKVRSRCQVVLEQFEIDYEKNPESLPRDLINLRDLTDETTAYSSFAKRYIQLKIENKPYAESLSSKLKLNEL